MQSERSWTQKSTTTPSHIYEVLQREKLTKGKNKKYINRVFSSRDGRSSNGRVPERKVSGEREIINVRIIQVYTAVKIVQRRSVHFIFLKNEMKMKINFAPPPEYKCNNCVGMDIWRGS